MTREDIPEEFRPLDYEDFSRFPRSKNEIIFALLRQTYSINYLLELATIQEEYLENYKHNLEFYKKVALFLREQKDKALSIIKDLQKKGGIEWHNYLR